MKSLRLLAGGILFLLMGVSLATAQTTVKQQGYRPTKRVTQLEPGKTYMIYNTCWNNGTEDRTGFISSPKSGNGFSHTGTAHPKPTDFVAHNDSYLWTVESAGVASGYYLKSVARNNYVTATGTYSAEASGTGIIYIQDWATSQCPKPSSTTTSSENSDATTKTVHTAITEGSGIWTICGTSVTSNGQSNGNGDCWNGNTTAWAKWSAAHPYAFYEYEITDEITIPAGFPVPGKEYFIYCDNGVYVSTSNYTEKLQYFYNNSGTLTVSNEAPTTDDEKYIFTCTYDGVYYQFQNKADNTKYFGFKGLANAPYNFRIEAGVPAGTAVHMYAVANSKYLVMNNDNSFNQSTVATDTKSDNNAFSANFIFVKTATQEWADAVADAKETLAKTGVGYPIPTAESRTTLQAALTAGENSTEDLATRATTLRAAVTAYRASTDNIQLPEDGKAYIIGSVNYNGVKRYMVYKESGLECTSRYKPDATPFIFRKLPTEGKYAIVCNAGKYLIWRGRDAGSNAQKGYVDTYNYTDDGASDWTQLTVEKLVKGTNMDRNQDAYFGYVAMIGRRESGTGKNAMNYIVIKTEGDFDQANAPFFKSGFSSALFMEEVTYPNTVTLHAVSNTDELIGGLAEGQTIGTFSAPFPTVIPSGVTAYMGTKDGDAVRMTAVTDATALPANQGVFLIGTAETTQALMLPATTETAADLSGNALSHSAGASHELTIGDYILGRGDDGIGLYQGTGTLPMNKAYLQMSGGSTRGFSLIFDGEPTLIESTLKAESEEAPVYDLSGRRVARLQKGGIYISKGRKFIVK